MQGENAADEPNRQQHSNTDAGLQHSAQLLSHQLQPGLVVGKEPGEGRIQLTSQPLILLVQGRLGFPAQRLQSGYQGCIVFLDLAKRRLCLSGEQ